MIEKGSLQTISWGKVLVASTVVLVLCGASFYAGHKFPVLISSNAVPHTNTAADIPTAEVTLSPVVANTSVDDTTANNSSVTIKSGETLTVIFHSTYWNNIRSSNSGILQGISSTAQPMTGGMMGSGAGTISAVFHGVTPGQAKITASRQSCGEALRCDANQSNFILTVNVQ